MKRLLHLRTVSSLTLWLIGTTLVGAHAENVKAENLKIVYVQLDRILQEAPQTIEGGKKLQREFSTRSKDLEALQNKIKDAETSMAKDKLTMSESVLRDKEREVSNMRVEFQRKQRELSEDINLRKNEELAILQDRINKAVISVATAENYDLVLYSGVAFASKKIDVTDKVLKSLGKK